MKLQLQSEAGDVDAFAVLGFEGEDKATAVSLAGQDGWLEEMRASGEFSGKLYETAVLHRPQGLKSKRLVLVGAGKRESFSHMELRRIAAALVRSLKSKGVRTIALSQDGTSFG